MACIPLATTTASEAALPFTLQAALKKLSSQRAGARLFSVPARPVAGARSRVSAGAAPGLQHASSGASLHSTSSTALALNGSSNRARRRRRASSMLPSRREVPCDELPSICHTLHCNDASAQRVLTLSLCQLGHCDPVQPCLAKKSGAELLLSHGCRRSSALRLSLSSMSLASRGAEAAEGAASSSHAAQRRRRHCRNGSFGSLGYPAPQPGMGRGQPAHLRQHR